MKLEQVLAAQLTVVCCVYLLLIDIGRATQTYPMWERLTQMTKAFLCAVLSRNNKTYENKEEMVCCIEGITAEISFDSSTALSRILSLHSRIHSFSSAIEKRWNSVKKKYSSDSNVCTKGEGNSTYNLNIRHHFERTQTHTHIHGVRQADQSHLWHFGTHVKYWFSLVVHIPI